MNSNIIRNDCELYKTRKISQRGEFVGAQAQNPRRVSTRISMRTSMNASRKISRNKYRNICWNKSRSICSDVCKKKIGYFLMIVFVIFAMAMNITTNASENNSIPLKYYTDIKIESGDTLYSIARKYNTSGSLSDSEYVDLICQINKLTGDELHRGRYLTIVYYDEEV